VHDLSDRDKRQLKS